MISQMKVGTRWISHVLFEADIFIDMFRSLSMSKLPLESVFSVTVGTSSKKTLASWHLLEPTDVVNTIAMLNGQGTSSATSADSSEDGN